jgi:phosphoglycerol transferase
MMNAHTTLPLRAASRLRVPPQLYADSFRAPEPAALVPPPKNSIASSILLYGATTLLSIAILILSLQLWRADLHVPFNYTTDGQDSFINMMLVKTVIETGWTAHNPLLGAPGTLNQLDFPNPESLHTILIYFLSRFSADFALVLNACFLLTFPLTALTTTFAARQIGLRPATSVMVAQLYTFLPFHFMRGEMHLALAGYYTVPLIVPGILAIAAGQFMSGWKRRTARIAFVLVGLSSPYYAMFGGFFLLVAVTAALVRRRDRTAFRESALLGFLLFATFVAQIIPNLLHTAEFGPNPLAGTRVLYEGDLYGLHLTQMLLPVPGHRIPALADFRDQYAAHAPMVNENESSALGIIASWGLLILIFHGLFRRTDTASSKTADPIDQEKQELLGILAILTLAGILLATVGGIGPTLNYLGFTTIRGYNRISIFLALFALLAVGIVIDRLVDRNRSANRAIGGAVCLTILVIGLLDQISPRFVPNYQQNAADFASDAKFIAGIESSVAAGASIFQFPVMDYPESAPVNKLSDYQLFRGYLHSSTLHWSYGAMKGRQISAWQQSLPKLPLQNAITQIRAKGFSGIYLDPSAYLDDTTEKTLQALLGQPLISSNGRLLFFRFQ